MNLDSYYRGTAIRIDIEVKDYDDNYMDPNTSINISVTDPAGSLKVDGQTPSKDDVGKYHYNVQTETDWIKGVILKPEKSGMPMFARSWIESTHRTQLVTCLASESRMASGS